MPRRSIIRAVPAKGAVIDMETGRPVDRPALPVICERIRSFRERAGLEQKALARAAGVTPNAVSNWENGRGRPDINLLPDICRALGVTLYELFGEEDPSVPYSEAEQELIRRYRELSPGHRAVMEQLADSLRKAEETENVPLLKRLTLYSRSLAAGFGDPTEFEDEGTPLWVYASREAERSDCVFTVNGDSMEPAYRDGDLVLVSRVAEAADLQPGETGAFIRGNETYIKIYEEDGLRSLNPAYGKLRFSGADRVYLIGRVTGILDPAQIARDEDIERFRMRYPEKA